MASALTTNGVSIGYQYDALNRLTNVIDHRLTGSTNKTSYTYDAVGNLQTLKYPNTLTNLYQFDSLNRVTNLTWKLAGAQRGDFFYQLGQAGNRTNLASTVASTNRNFAWAYDSAYRLTNETVTGAAPTGTLTFVYDDAGNRTGRIGSIGSVSTNNTPVDKNDWLDNDVNITNANLNFDLNGNRTNFGVTLFKYDWENHLTNGKSIDYLYDATGIRLKKVMSTSTNLYLVAGVNPTGYPQVVEELSVSGSTTNLVKTYTYGLDLISQRTISGGASQFYGYDGLGSTTFLTDSAGAVGNIYAYEAYGTTFVSTGSTVNRYQFAGEQYDADLGLYYSRARYYGTYEGRFWTADSYEGDRNDPLSLHRYLYASDNPVNRIDPSGHEDIVATVGNLALQGYVRAMVFTATRPVLARVGGLVVGVAIGSQIDDAALQGLPQFQGLGAMQAAEVKMLDALKRGPIYRVLTQQLKGLMSYDAGHAFQDWLKKNIFKRILAENVSVSSTTRHSVDFELDNALIEAKNALDIDATQLAHIAAKAKELGKDFWYVFLKKPSQGVVDRIKNRGGNVSWFLDEND